MYYFCTYFDHRYLSRGLALYRSLRRHCPSFRLWVLCMDRKCYEVLSQLSLADIYLIALEDFERGDHELLRARQNRSLIEYYFTCTPSLVLFILNNWPEVDLITYLDADLFFFAEPAPIYDEIAGHSIAIIEHRFPPHLRDRERYGIYNIGWLSFKCDEFARNSLLWWRERCIEWCYDRVEDGRFADQKYLDDWPARFQSVVVLQHKGANLAPWNLANYTIRTNGNFLLVDEDPLIFFHFHGLERISKLIFDPDLSNYKVTLSRVVRRSIYLPYIHTLLNVSKKVSPFFEKASLQSSIRGEKRRSRAHHRVTRLRRMCKGVLNGKLLLVFNIGE